MTTATLRLSTPKPMPMTIAATKAAAIGLLAAATIDLGQYQSLATFALGAGLVYQTWRNGRNKANSQALADSTAIITIKDAENAQIRRDKEAAQEDLKRAEVASAALQARVEVLESVANGTAFSEQIAAGFATQTETMIKHGDENTLKLVEAIRSLKQPARVASRKTDKP